MSNEMRFRRTGETNKYKVLSATVIEQGDMVWYDDANGIKPASDFTWTTDLPTTQAAFKAKFVGIAAGSSPAGAEVDLAVGSGGDVYEMDATSDTYLSGVPVGPADRKSVV